MQRGVSIRGRKPATYSKPLASSKLLAALAPAHITASLPCCSAGLRRPRASNASRLREFPTQGEVALEVTRNHELLLKPDAVEGGSLCMDLLKVIHTG